MSDELQQLRDIIVDSVDKILASCGRRNEEFPVLNAPAHSSEFSQKGIRNDAAIIEASTVAISAAAQLIATLQPPAITLANAAGSVRGGQCPLEGKLSKLHFSSSAFLQIGRAHV